jgi:8-oxo-dGTP diphosphatase
MFAPTLFTLVYVVSPDRRNVLLMHRDKRPADVHFGKHVGLGGRVERDEDVATGARREVTEESGLVANELVLRGTVSWTGFFPSGEDAFAFIFRCDSFDGVAHAGNEEGTLRWVPRDELLDVPMWTSDRLWLPMVFDDAAGTFHGYMPYRDQEMVSWSYVRA